MSRRHQLEAGAVLESEPKETEPPQQENPETEPLRESASTVRELLDLWHEQLPSVEGDAKQELYYKIAKMGLAISHARLSPEEVKIRETAPGVLGFYVPSTGEIAITPEGLALPAEHFAEVLIHEATHAGKITGKRVSDEGIAQIITEQRVNTMGGIYEQEKGMAKDTLSRPGIQHVLDAYDFDNPPELIELYLKTEWQDAWSDRWEAEAIGHAALETEAGRQELLDGEMKNWADELEENFEQAAPRLYGEAEKQGFKWQIAHQENFEVLVKASLVQKTVDTA